MIDFEIPEEDIQYETVEDDNIDDSNFESDTYGPHLAFKSTAAGAFYVFIPTVPLNSYASLVEYFNIYKEDLEPFHKQLHYPVDLFPGESNISIDDSIILGIQKNILSLEDFMLEIGEDINNPTTTQDLCLHVKKILSAYSEYIRQLANNIDLIHLT